MAKLLILYNDDGFFAGSLKTNDPVRSMNLLKLKQYFEKKGHIAEVHCYSEITFPSKYCGWYVMYASSEDAGLFYKDYLEDILLRLIVDGAVLLPSFDFFRAHHNKAYMELLRTGFTSSTDEGSLDSIKTQVFGGYDAFIKNMDFEHTAYPLVVKSSAGSGSSGVILAKNEQELIAAVKRVSKRSYRDLQHTFYKAKGFQLLKNFYRKLTKTLPVVYHQISGKFIIQTFVPELGNDFKVLVFGDKFYVLRRNNRDGDFRASGSGKFTFPSEIDEICAVLSFAKFAYETIDMPLASLDIGFDGKKCNLIEFQCLNFGPYTLQFSEWYFIQTEAGWEKVVTESELEQEYVNAIDLYLKRKNLQ